MYKRSMEEAAPGATLPGDKPPLPMIDADFLRFGSKSGLAHLRWKNSAAVMLDELAALESFLFSSWELW
jgi:hypothetical protein